MIFQLKLIIKGKNEKEKNFAKIPQVEQRETSLLFVEACVIL